MPCITEDWPDTVYNSYYRRKEHMRDTLRVLVEHGKVEVEQQLWHPWSESHFTALEYFDGSVDDFLWLAAEERITLVGDELQAFYEALPTDMINMRNSVDIVRAVLSKLLDHFYSTMVPPRGVTVLHGLVAMLVFNLFDFSKVQDLYNTIHMVLDRKADIHAADMRGYTSLQLCNWLSIFAYARHQHVQSMPLRRHQRFFQTAATWCTRLKLWTDFLKQSGRDLHEYVRIERERGIELWISASRAGINPSYIEYFQSWLVMSRILLNVVASSDGEEILDIRLEIAAKEKSLTVPGAWVNEESQASSSEDEDGWTLYCPYIDDDASDFNKDCEDDYDEGHDDDYDDEDEEREEQKETDDGDHGEGEDNARREGVVRKANDKQ